MNLLARNQTPSPQQMKELAARFGVSYRTIERWFTAAGQKINIVPRAVAGNTLDGLRGTAAGARAAFAFGLAGEIGSDAAGQNIDHYQVRFFNFQDAEDYAEGLQQGRVDPFLDRHWSMITVVPSLFEDSWVVEVDYWRIVFGGS